MKKGDKMNNLNIKDEQQLNNLYQEKIKELYNLLVTQKFERKDLKLLQYIFPSNKDGISLETRNQILKTILDSEACMEQIFKNITQNETFYLKEFSRSPHYPKLYQKYRHNIFEAVFHNFYMLRMLKNQNTENSDLVETVLLIIEDACRLGGVSVIDMDFFERGSYSVVYKAGDYLIKLGRKRLANKIAADPNLLYPFCRKYIKEFDLFIEVTSLENPKNIDMEDVYQIFKAIREEGRCWIDAKTENVVRLTKENGSYPFEVDPETIGFIGEMPKSKKTINECVICDTDLLYDEKNVPWELINEECSKKVLEDYQKLEERYQQEILQRRKKF